VDCPNCKAESRVIDSRARKGAIRRRRVCQHCEHRFTTYKTNSDHLRDLMLSWLNKSINADEIGRLVKEKCEHAIRDYLAEDNMP